VNTINNRKEQSAVGDKKKNWEARGKIGIAGRKSAPRRKKKESNVIGVCVENLRGKGKKTIFWGGAPIKGIGKAQFFVPSKSLETGDRKKKCSIWPQQEI